MSDDVRDGFHTVSKYPAPGALPRARTWLSRLAPGALARFDHWTSLACICDTGWLAGTRRLADPDAAMARIMRRRLRVLTSLPLAFSAFKALRAGDGPIHLKGRCAGLPGHDAIGPLWRTEVQDDQAGGRILIEEGHDFLLSVDGGAVYVLSNGGHLPNATPLYAGDEASVFGFADEVPDRLGMATAAHGRGGLLPAIRSGSELPLLVTRVVR